MRERAQGIRLALMHRDFRRLWLAQFSGDLGDAIARIALAILVYDETGSSFLTAAVIGVGVLAYLGPGQALTAWAERFPRRSVLIAADLVRAACFAAIALPLPLGVRFALLFVSSLADPPFLAVRRALVPTTLPDDRYGDAVTLTTITTEFCYLAGAALGGVLTGVIGPSGVLVMNASTFIVSAVLLMLLRAGRIAITSAATVATRLTDGVAAIRGDARLRRLFWLFPAASVGVLGAEALITPLTKEVLERGETVIGSLAAVISVGVLLATAGLRPHLEHDALVRQTVHLAAIGGLFAAVGFLAPVGVPAAVMAYTGVGIVFAFRVPLTIVFGQRLADDVRASAMSLLDGVYAFGVLIASLGAGVLADLTDPRTACIAFTSFSVVVAVLARVLPIATPTEELDATPVS